MSLFIRATSIGIGLLLCGHGTSTAFLQSFKLEGGHKPQNAPSPQKAARLADSGNGAEEFSDLIDVLMTRNIFDTR